MLPQENFEFRFSQIASDATWDKFNTCDKTLITILNIKISGREKLWLGGGGKFQLPPPPPTLYETLLPEQWTWRTLTLREEHYLDLFSCT